MLCGLSRFIIAMHQSYPSTIMNVASHWATFFTFLRERVSLLSHYHRKLNAAKPAESSAANDSDESAAPIVLAQPFLRRHSMQLVVSTANQACRALLECGINPSLSNHDMEWLHGDHQVASANGIIASPQAIEQWLKENVNFRIYFSMFLMVMYEWI